MLSPWLQPTPTLWYSRCVWANVVCGNAPQIIQQVSEKLNPLMDINGAQMKLHASIHTSPLVSLVMAFLPFLRHKKGNKFEAEYNFHKLGGRDWQKQAFTPVFSTLTLWCFIGVSFYFCFFNFSKKIFSQNSIWGDYIPHPFLSSSIQQHISWSW